MGIAYRNYLTIDGKSTLDFNTWISGGGTYGTPSRDVDIVSVPGRNGDLTFDNGRFNNISVAYDAFITEKFNENIAALRAFLGSLTGYKRLEDTYHPDEYRMALFTAGVQPKTTTLNRAGSFTLTFNCKPQRFLKSGERPIEFEAGGSVLNNTLFEARPLLRVYGTGTFGIGSTTITITSANDYTDIDCDLMDAYKDGTNCNANVTLNSGSFPVLSPGSNGVTLGTGITKIIIYPRFYTI